MIEDSLGRSADIKKGLLQSLLQAKVTPVAGSSSAQSATNDKTLEKVQSLLEQLGANISQEMKGVVNYFKEIITEQKNKNTQRSGTKNLGSINKNLSAFTKKALSENTLPFKEKILRKEMKRANLLAEKGNKILFGVSGDHTKKGVEAGMKSFFKKSGKEISGTGTTDVPVVPPLEIKGQDKLKYWTDLLRSTTTALLGGSDVLGTIFQEVASGPLNYRKELGKIRFETQGLTGEGRTLTSLYSNLKKDLAATGDVVGETGQTISTFYNQHVKNLRKGLGLEKDRLKAEKQAIGVTKTGLGLSTLIGSNTEQTAEMLYEWHQHLGFSDKQLSTVARSIQHIGRLTGVSGDNLLRAAKNAESLLKTMRLAGTLTADATRNMIMLQTQAEKLGIANQVQGLMTAMSSTQEFLNAAQDTQTLAVMLAGKQTDKLLKGTLLHTREGLKEVGKNADRILREFSGGMASAEDIIKGNVSADVLFQLNAALKPLGTTAMTLALSSKQNLEAAKPLSDRLKELIVQREKAVSSDKKAQLEKDISSARFAAAMSGLEAISSKLENGSQTIGDALSSVKTQSEDTFADLSAAINSFDLSGIAAPEEQMRALGVKLAEDIKSRGGDAKQMDELIRGIMSNDPAKFSDSITELTEANNKLQQNQAASVDPITELARELMKLNQWLQTTLGPLISWAVNKYTLTGAAIISGLFGLTAGLRLGNKLLFGLPGKLTGLLGRGLTTTIGAGLGMFGLKKQGNWVANLGKTVSAGVGNAVAANSCCEGSNSTIGYNPGLTGMLRKWGEQGGIGGLLSNKKWIAGGLGAAAGLIAAEGVHMAFKKYIGSPEVIGERSLVKGMLASISQDAGSILAGFATGGFIGGIVAGLDRIVRNIIEISSLLNGWRKDAKDQKVIDEKIKETEIKGRKTVEGQISTGMKESLEAKKVGDIEKQRAALKKATIGLLHQQKDHVRGNLQYAYHKGDEKMIKTLKEQWNRLGETITKVNTGEMNDEQMLQAGLRSIDDAIEISMREGNAEISKSWKEFRGRFEKRAIDKNVASAEKAAPKTAAGPKLEPSQAAAANVTDTRPGYARPDFGLSPTNPMPTPFSWEAKDGKFYKMPDGKVGKYKASDKSYEIIEPQKFDVGSKFLKQGGLAILHKGEQVIPSNIVAESAGPFASNNPHNFIPHKEIARLFTENPFVKPSETEPVIANSKPLVDVYDRIREQQAGTESVVATSTAKEMSSIDRATNKQVDLLTLLHKDMEKLIDLFTSAPPIGNSESVGIGNKNRNSLPMPNYGQWAHPGYSGNASRRIIFDGR